MQKEFNISKLEANKENCNKKVIIFQELEK